VEGDGKKVLRLSADDQLELDWSAAQCKVQTPDGKQTTSYNRKSWMSGN
jgi:hypothetical protein